MIFRRVGSPRNRNNADISSILLAGIGVGVLMVMMVSRTTCRVLAGASISPPFRREALISTFLLNGWAGYAAIGAIDATVTGGRSQRRSTRFTSINNVA